MLVNVLLCFYTLFEAYRFFYTVAALFGMKPELMNALGKFFIVAFGVILIGMMIYFEDRYRNAFEEGSKKLLARFFIFSGIQLLLIALFQGPFFFTLGYKLGWAECVKYFIKPALGLLLVLSSLSLSSRHSH